MHHSIEAAVRAAGLPEKLAHQVLAMFTANGEAHDAHPGDRINILYHEYFVGNKKDHPGNVVAAEIVDGKKDYRMVRFVAPNHTAQFYTPSGQGTKPLFLPFPLHYQRIGSRFNYHRYDPVLHKIRPHLGVDFDAPLGTPVKAISDGVVLFSKQMRGYGNVLMIRYHDRYKALYAHLERFASYIKPNTHVKKGEVVGYVGSTGWSTGPHLHFAIYKNGVPVNPLTVQFPHGSAVPEKYRQIFFEQTNRWFSEMRLYKNEQTSATQVVDKKAK
jgi:murein DD-endopeptidase MepM/ murein hydrolase activator NlpD